MRNWFRQRLPKQDTLTAQPGLRWMAPLLRRPWLWRLNRRSVALGAGIGVFFGFIVPVMQIPGAAVLATLLRANLPVAAVATFVSNPLTFAPIGLFAYQTGAALLGETATARAVPGSTTRSNARTTITPADWLRELQSIGKPLMLGLAVFAVIGGVSTWALVHLAWTLAVHIKRRRRLRYRYGQ